MKFKGLSKTKVLRTSEDVLEHSYGRKVEKAEQPPPPAAAPPPPPPPPPPEEDVDVELTKDEYAEQLIDGNKKDDLIAMAEGLGLYTDGTKAELAARIAAYEYGE